MMWKPGSSKPSNKDKDNVHIPSHKKQNGNSAKSPSNNGNSSKSPSSKKLSGSTMGMRFMQRKKKDSSSSTKPVIHQNHNNIHTTINKSVHNNNVDRKRENRDISKDDEQPTSEVIILELASVVDMYGVGSDIIGRRSFGGFHKSVKNTYDTALKRRTDDHARSQNTKHQITDEELLERYEKYVKGGNTNSNRGRKEKRKRG